jgi:ribosomal protein L11 methyltransferase
VTAPIKQYLEIIFEGLPRSIEPALSSWLFRNGCWGTQEILAFTQPNLKYEPKRTVQKFINVSAFFDPQSRERVEGPILVWLREHSPATQITWQVHEAKDWLKEWKKHFKPFSVAGLKIVPVWEAKKTKLDKMSLLVEPGMAFGTGTHATTRFAMEMIQKLHNLGLIAKKTVLDVGAGSGILSIVSEKYGAKSAIAIDNDFESWRECRKSFKLNNTKKCKVVESQIDNIIDGVLMELKEHLWKKTKKGGYLILSGVLTAGANAFEKDFLAGKEAKVLSRTRDEEWTSLLISK